MSLLDRVVDAMGQAVIVTDPGGVVLHWNPAAERLYGWSAAEASGHLVRELILPPDARAAAVAESTRVRGGEGYAGDWDVRDRDGNPLTVFITTTPVLGDDGEVVALLGVARDVSERRAAEARARQLAAIVEGSNDAILEHDTNGIVRTANAAVRDVFGYEPAELVGRHISVIVPEDRRAEGVAMTATVLAGESVAAFTTERVRKDGVRITTSLRLSPVRDADGAVVGISGITRDVSEEVRTRAALEASERLFRARFDRVALAQFVADIDGRVQSVNDAFCALVGRSRDDLAGTSLGALRHPTNDTAGVEGFAAVVRGDRESETLERVMARPDGTAVPVLVHMTLLREAGGTPHGLAGFVHDLTGLRSAQDELARREAFFSALASQATDWALVTDAAGTLRYVSPSIAAAFGHDPADLADADVWAYVHEDDAAEAREAFAGVCATPGATATRQFRVRAVDGEWRWAEHVLANRLDDAVIGGIVWNGRDITARVDAQQALRASEARYRAIADTAQEGIWTLDRAGATLYANRKLAEILGVPIETVYATPSGSLLDPDGSSLAGDRMRRPHGRGPDQYEVAYQHPDGTRRVLRLSVSPLSDDGGATGSLAMIADVTDAHRAEDELRRRALRDELTGLANRSLLEDRLENALARAERAAAPVAVLFADLDHFKHVNDSLGHAAGDDLLRQVATRIGDAVRPGDTVARFGGDEFVVVCEGADEAAARAVADDLLGALTAPFLLGEQRTYVNASIGLALAPPHSAAELLRFAETAMYDAKAGGRGRLHVFDAALAEAAADRLVVGNDLRDALRSGGLELRYQPIVDLATGRAVGVEALARWEHPQRGSLPPAKFVAIAESLGLIRELDEWAVESACRDSREVRRILGPHASIAVNVSGKHLSEAGFEEHLLDAVRRHRVPRGGIALEITEGAVVERPEHTRALLSRLRERGIAAAIDDFGTGYSSLAYLTRLPVTTLKVDRGFVENITADPDALAIAASIVDLARTVKLATVAEGVENVAQLTVLETLGCTYGQGFLWARALPLPDLAATVAALPGGVFDVTRRSTMPLPRAAREEKVTADHGLRELMRLHRDGASLSTIAAALNSDGFRTPRGLRWHRSTVAQVISDTAYPHLWLRS